MNNTPRFNIDTCAMLVELNASVWTARKLDRKVTDEVTHDKHAAKDAARVNKNLLAGRNELDKIVQHVNAARAYAYSTTLPWSDNGIRLLPALTFMKFNDRITQFKDEFDTMVADFVRLYPSLITAQAMALGHMFDRNEYPTASEIASRFNFRVNYLPVPTAGDFRVDIGNDATNELKKQMQALEDEYRQKIIRAPWDELAAFLHRMIDRLAVDSIGGVAKPRVFHDSMFEVGMDLCERLKELNIANDPKLEEQRQELRRILTTADASTLRKDMATREHTRDKVKELIGKFTF